MSRRALLPVSRLTALVRDGNGWSDHYGLTRGQGQEVAAVAGVVPILTAGNSITERDRAGSLRGRTLGLVAAAAGQDVMI
jgi:hypothetical protein